MFIFSFSTSLDMEGLENLSEAKRKREKWWWARLEKIKTKKKTLTF